MVKERRKQLEEFFQKYDLSVQRIVMRVLELEQQEIDSDRPRVKEQIRQFIDQEVRNYDLKKT